MSELYSAAGSLFIEKKSSNSLELILARRVKTSSFFPDYYVMPGGLISKEDVQVGEESLQFLEPKEGGIIEAAYRIAFLREFFEETAIWPFNQGDLSIDEALFLRKKLVEKKISFHDFLDVINIHPSQLPLQELKYIGVRITPPFSSRVYVTRYYLLGVKNKPHPIKYDAEHSEVAWFNVKEMLERYETLDAKLPPPTLQQLRFLANMPLEKAISELVSKDHTEFGVGLPIEILPNLEVIPIKTLTIPPLETTNMVIMGGQEFYVVDPGSGEDKELEHQVAIIQRLINEGNQPKGIIITHHHKDHWMGVEALVREFELPVFAHEKTISKLTVDFKVNALQGGENLTVKDKNGFKYHLEVLWTPGHTKGSICVRDGLSNAIAVGDLLAGIGTIVLIPGESNLKQYLNSLSFIAALKPRIIVPGHGPVIQHPLQVLEYYLTHRKERHHAIKQVLTVYKPRSLNELVEKVYTDVSKELYHLAKQSLLVHLEALLEEGFLSQRYYEVLTTSEDIKPHLL